MDKKDYYVPMKSECPFEKNCTGYPSKCNDCKHNPNRDYFEPRPWPQRPHPYWGPYWRYPYITWM